MSQLIDRANMRVSGTPGTGPITLGSAVAGYQTFAAAGVVNGATVSYVIQDGTNWEYGRGTYFSSGPTLARTTILGSSSSGAPISVSSSATVFLTALAEDLTTPTFTRMTTGPITQTYPSGSAQSQICHDLLTRAPADSDGRAGAQHLRLIAVNGLETNGPPSDTNYTDNVVGFGWNLTNAFTNLDTTKPAASIRIENMFTQGGRNPFGAEFHLATLYSIQGTEHRMVEAFAPHNDSDALGSSVLFSGNNVYFTDYSGNEWMKWSFNTPNPYMQIFGGVVQQFLRNNVPVITQSNAAGTSTIALPYIDNNGNTVVSSAIATRVSGGMASGPIVTSVGNNGLALLAHAPGSTYASIFVTSGQPAAKSVALSVLSDGSLTLGQQTTGGYTYIQYNNAAIFQSLTAGTNQLTIGPTTVAAGIPVKNPPYTVATLPTPSATYTGCAAYASNGRKAGEGPGAGTGIPVWCDGSAWRTYYDNTVAAASRSAATASPSSQPSSTGSRAGAGGGPAGANSGSYQFFSHPNSSAASVMPAAKEQSFLPRFATSSTIPSNGDLNPYGVAFVPEGFPAGGSIAPGDLLVTNFSAKGNLKGTGTTIVKPKLNGPVGPLGPVSTSGADTFFHSLKQVGLTTALGVLRAGYVLVGNVPTRNGTSGTISQGSLQIVDRYGQLVSTLIDSLFLDSPWGLTINDQGSKAQVFVSNVMSGKVSRLDLAVNSSSVSVMHRTEIAMGYAHRPDPVALALGPTGLAYDTAVDVLYVASTADNMIFAVPQAGKAAPMIVTKGTPLFSNPNHLRGPLGLVFAPNGHLLVANGDAVNADPTCPSRIIEFTTSGEFVGELNIDPDVNAASGLATLLSGNPGFNFAAVNGNSNSVAVVQTN